MAAQQVITITDADFEAQVLQSPLPVLLDFWAEWCGPCRMMTPVVDELAAAYAGKAVIAKMNVDDNPLTPARYGVRSIPSIKLFKDGQLADEVTGAVPRQRLEEMLRKAL